MPAVGIVEIRGTLEKGLQAPFGAGDDSGVISEEEAADDGDENDREQIGFAAFFLGCHIGK